jgi:hypothetical protein
MTDYCNAQCVAITHAGKQCTGRWSSALPCMWQWDPVKGVGIEGPHIVLCHRHRHWSEPKRLETVRFPVVAGWFGAYNEHGYGSAVWSAPTGWTPAAEWWAQRSACNFGGPFRRDAFC